MSKDTESEQPAVSVEENSVNWHPLQAVGITLLIFFGVQIIGGVLVALYPALKGWSRQTTLDWFSTSTLAQFFTIVIIASLTVLLLWLYLRRKKRSFKTLGLISIRWKDLLYTLSGLAVYIPALIFVLLVVSSLVPGLNTEQEQQIGFEAARSGAELLLVFISLAMLPAFIEELLMRGFLYSGLRSKLPVWAAALITSVLFATAHLEFGSGAPLLWVAAIDTFVLSLVLVWLREISGSLWPAIGLHLIKNSVAFISLFLIK